MYCDGRPSGSPRRLLIVPIIHGEEDLGSLARSVKEQKIRRLGFKGWRKNVAAVDRAWARAEVFFASLPKNLRGWRLYQDGLPVCGREREIVAELAANGRRNHSLLRSLVDRGAELIGTESPALLIEELENARRSLSGASGVLTPSNAASLLERRDRFMAARIAETLPPAGIGVLLAGALHNVGVYLPPDIVIERPSEAEPGQES